MKYQVTVSTRDEWDADGAPVRDVVFETDSFAEVMEYEAQHGGTVVRDDGAVLAPDWVWLK